MITQDMIDDVRTALSQAKEECFDGTRWDAEPCIDKEITDWTEEDHRTHSDWSARTWDMFDALPVSEVKDVLADFPWLTYDERETVGNIYEMLSRLEESA